MLGLIKDSISNETPYGIKFKIGRVKYEAVFEPNNMMLYILWDENGEQKHQGIRLISEPSNLVKSASVFYFVCPNTGCKTRKMYKIGDVFASRKSAKGLFYPKQNYSKKWREISYMENPVRKYGKPYYNGNETPYGKRCRKYEEREEKIKTLLPKYFKLSGYGFGY